MVRVFQFCSSASLVKLTGLRAYNLEELLQLVRSCPSSSIFYHTFAAFRKMREVQAPYTNDFAVWILRYLHEEALTEKLMALDLSDYDTVEDLRFHLVEIIENFREEKRSAFEKMADVPFYLSDVVRFVYLTDKFAYDLASFRQLLETVSADSLYYHLIESRLQTKPHTDDFSRWIEESGPGGDLAHEIRQIDIHLHTLEELREKLLEVIDEHLETG